MIPANLFCLTEIIFDFSEMSSFVIIMLFLLSCCALFKLLSYRVCFVFVAAEEKLLNHLQVMDGSFSDNEIHGIF